MNNVEMQKIIDNSIWMGNKFSTFFTDNAGKLHEYSITENTRREYVEQFLKWNHIFKNIIGLIKVYTTTGQQDYPDISYKNQIREELEKLEAIKLEAVGNEKNYSGGSQRIFKSSYLYIKRGTKLFRYTDDVVNHIYANPKPLNYGRFTVPGRPGTFYLAFDKNVAREEVKGSNSTKLVEFEITNDLKALIIPGSLPVYVKEDKFFETRLKQFHNLVFSLKPEDAYFNDIDKTNSLGRLRRAIYIVTNELFEIVKETDSDIIVYPSTKVKQNSYLGTPINNKYFVPNNKNSDLAIINDVNLDKNGNAFSKYVKVIKKYNVE